MKTLLLISFLFTVNLFKANGQNKTSVISNGDTINISTVLNAITPKLSKQEFAKIKSHLQKAFNAANKSDNSGFTKAIRNFEKIMNLNNDLSLTYTECIKGCPPIGDRTTAGLLYCKMKCYVMDFSGGQMPNNRVSQSE
jgi:hypothetical protein